VPITIASKRFTIQGGATAGPRCNVATVHQRSGVSGSVADGLERLLDGLTAEDPEVVALFEPDDEEGMQILRELGIDVQGANSRHAFVLRTPRVKLEEAYRPEEGLAVRPLTSCVRSQGAPAG
jgi:hypothetical protein